MINDSFNVAKSQVSFLKGSQSERTEQRRPTEATAPNEKHLSTGHLLDNLKGRTISSGLITIAAQGIKFALNLASIMVLARLLTPRDFGLYAMVTTIMGYVVTFKDAALSTATVQREGITHAQVSNLFWINVALSGALSLLLAAGSPLVAWFYREPRLVPITLILSSTFFLSGLTIQHTALLNRQMRFTALAFIQIASMLTGVIIGIGMAWLGYRYWALVFSNAFSSFNPRCARTKVGEGSHYFCRVRFGSAVRSGCKSCRLVVHQSRPRRKRLVTCQLAGCGSHGRFFRGWSAIRTGRTRDRLFHR